MKGHRTSGVKRRLKLLKLCIEAGPVHYRYYRGAEYPMGRVEAFRAAADETYRAWRAFRRPVAG